MIFSTERKKRPRQPILAAEGIVLFNDISLARYDIRRCRMKSAIEDEIKSVPIFRRKADFITQVISSIKDGFIPDKGRI